MARHGRKKSGSKKTSSKLAKLAAKVLKSRRSSKKSKRLAGSVLSQYPGRKRK